MSLAGSLEGAATAVRYVGVERGRLAIPCVRVSVLYLACTFECTYTLFNEMGQRFSVQQCRADGHRRFLL